ncbi:unnamed protein product [Polarella glacialis]|uniref:MYND-type domain-containing protein n=1 Tax=Polarella glacialis TaxID=89957 RepID=A0A813JTA5_POLGL|nr:unnamed protein product [Polarella glacialis]
MYPDGSQIKRACDIVCAHCTDLDDVSGLQIVKQLNNSILPPSLPWGLGTDPVILLRAHLGWLLALQAALQTWIDKQNMDHTRATMEKKLCELCGNAAEQKCGKCLATYYCCIAHQTADWKKHKGLCLGAGTCSILKRQIFVNTRLTAYLSCLLLRAVAVFADIACFLLGSC